MRTKRLLVAVGLGVAAAVVPATPAAASCIEVEGVGCFNPGCIVAAAANTALEAVGSDERVVCTL